MLLDAHFHPLSALSSDSDSTNGSLPNGLNTTPNKTSPSPIAIGGVGASATPEEWGGLRLWSSRQKQPFILGLHPWLAEVLALNPQGENQLQNYLNSLEKLIGLDPAPCAIGEIGFDKVHSQIVNWAWQNKLFIAQYRLAQKYALPIVIHCVKSYGYLLEALSQLSRKFKEPLLKGLIHAFWGSPQLALRLVKLNFFISLNSRLLWNAKALTSEGKNSKLTALAKVIPLSQLLLESDAPWGLPSSTYTKELCSLLAPYWKVEAAQLQERAQANLRLFYNLPANN